MHLDIQYNFFQNKYQNIDDLHERAGSKNIIHLHGEIFKMRSDKNENLISEIRGDINLGDKAADGAQLRPHIVWFEEPVPMIEDAALVMGIADIFVLIGTSLQVYPAAGLLHYVPENAEKYVIDKKIPEVHGVKNLITIEESATTGITKLLDYLR